MTVLVLGLRVPVNVPESSLSAEILALWPNILTYALSFVTLGLYWVGHHNQFHYIKHTDRVLLWINILFLMSIGFVPFSTSLLGGYPWPPSAIRVYGGNLMANGLCLYATWWYATKGGRLVEKDLDPHIVALVKRRILVGPAILLVGILFSFLDTRASVILFMLVIPFYVRPSHIDIHFRGSHQDHEKRD